MNKAIARKIKKLEEATSRFLGLIDQHNTDQRTKNPEPNSWNMLQVIEHIVTAENALATNFKKRPPSLSEYKTNFRQTVNSTLLGIVMKSPLKVKAPSYLEPPKGDQSFENYKEQLETCRVLILGEARQMPEDRLNRTVMKHPVAGPLTFPQTLEFMANHIDHHYKQLKRISKSIK